jgi:hypothetical protein
MRGQKIIRIVDGIPTSAATSLGILIGALLGKNHFNRSDCPVTFSENLPGASVFRGRQHWGQRAGYRCGTPIDRTLSAGPNLKAPFTNLDDWRILAKCPRCVWPPKTLASINRLAPHRFRPFPGEPWAVAGWQDTAPLVFRFVARAHFSLWRRVTLGSRCGGLRCLAAASLRLPIIDGVPTFRRGRRFGTHSDIGYAECFDL